MNTILIYMTFWYGNVRSDEYTRQEFQNSLRKDIFVGIEDIHVYLKNRTLQVLFQFHSDVFVSLRGDLSTLVQSEAIRCLVPAGGEMPETETLVYENYSETFGFQNITYSLNGGPLQEISEDDLEIVATAEPKG